MADRKKSIHTDHRQRMKKEFLDGGIDSWPDHRVMEMLLFYALPQGDVNPLAHRLIEHFGNVAKVLDADPDKLLKLNGISLHTAALIHFLPALFKRYAQQRADLGEICQTSWDFRALLEPEFFGARNELVYMVCLDAKYELIGTFMLGEGIADAATITTRKVMETALGCNASIIVLAHNHVSGLALPSAEDIMTTKQLARSLKLVGILLHDHFVFVDGDMTSMRDSGYLDD